MTTDTTVTVRERCCCGATFVYRGTYPETAGQAFRRDHQHERPARDVGQCAAPFPLLMSLPVAVAERAVAADRPLFCSLDAGHTGTHHNDETGGSWWKQSTTPEGLTMVPVEAVSKLLEWADEVGHMTERDDINSARVWEHLTAFRMAVKDTERVIPE